MPRGKPLAPETRDTIIRLYRAGLSGPVVAAQTGVCVATVSRVAAGIGIHHKPAMGYTRSHLYGQDALGNVEEDFDNG